MASALLMLSPLPTMAAMVDTTASDLPRLSPRRLPHPTMATAEAMATMASALLMLRPLPTMAAMEATTAATDTMASDLPRLSPRRLPLPTMAMATAEAMATMASALLMLSPRRSPRLLLNTTSLFTDTTGTMASAPLMLSLLPSTSMPTLPMDTTMVNACSTP